MKPESPAQPSAWELPKYPEGPRCIDCGGLFNEFNGPIILGRCNVCHAENGPTLTKCPVGDEEYTTLEGVCITHSVKLVPINRHLLEVQ